MGEVDLMHITVSYTRGPVCASCDSQLTAQVTSLQPSVQLYREDGRDRGMRALEQHEQHLVVC